MIVYLPFTFAQSSAFFPATGLDNTFIIRESARPDFAGGSDVKRSEGWGRRRWHPCSEQLIGGNSLISVMPQPSVTNYRQDLLYVRIVHATDDILRHGKVVIPVDVLVGMDLLTRQHLED